MATGRPGLMATRQNTSRPIASTACAHMVGFAGRDAARGEHEIVLGRRRGDGAREPLADRRAGCRDRSPRRRVARAGRRADSGWRRTAPRPAAARPARRSRRRSRTPRRARAAAPSSVGQPDRGGERDMLRGEPPARPAARPPRRARPRRRAGGWRRASSPAGTITASPSTRTSSCMNTVSAPAGIGAPVKMRIASPRRQARAPRHGRRSRARRPRAGSRPWRRDRRGAPRSRRPRNCRTAADRSARRRRAPARARARPASGTVSVSATGATRSRDHPLDLVDRQQRAGEGEAVVGELRHHRLSACASDGRERHGVPEQNVGDRARCRRDRRPALAPCGSGASEAIATIAGSSGCSSGLPTPARWTSSLGCGSRLKPSTSTRSTGASFSSSCGAASAPARRATHAPAPSAWPSRPAPRSRRPCGACANPCPAGRRRSRDARA